MGNQFRKISTMQGGKFNFCFFVADVAVIKGSDLAYFSMFERKRKNRN